MPFQTKYADKLRLLGERLWPGGSPGAWPWESPPNALPPSMRWMMGLQPNQPTATTTPAAPTFPSSQWDAMVQGFNRGHGFEIRNRQQLLDLLEQDDGVREMEARGYARP